MRPCPFNRGGVLAALRAAGSRANPPAAGGVLFTFILAAALVCGVPPHCVRAADTSPIQGDWAGWAYFDGGKGDGPLRLHVDPDDSLSVRFDELTRAEYDLPARLAKWRPPQIVIERIRPNGQTIRLEGKVSGDSISGRIEWASVPGRFELTRSALRISRLRPDAFADLQGYYQLAPGRTLAIGSRFWGELLYTDLGTGRQGTLFPLDRDSFFGGGAMYVPRPVAVMAQFHRDAGGKPSGVSWSVAGGDTLQGDYVPVYEEPVQFLSDTTRISGTLLRPTRSASLPAVVILGGSDWALRTDCRRDAEILCSFGMATLVFDRRGHGASGGKAVHSFHDDASDAVAAVKFLRGRANILPDQVGLTGRSQGGWIAPMAAFASGTVKFLVLFVPPAVSPAEQEMTRRLHVLSDARFSAAALKQEREMMELAFAYSASGTGWDKYLAARQAAKAAGFPEDVLESDKPDDPDWEWGRLNWRYDPVPTLQQIQCPVLALFGGADENVVPSDNLPLMRRAFAKAKNENTLLLEIPGADHALVAPPAGTAELPLHRQQGIGNQGWPKIYEWLSKQVQLGGVVQKQ